MTNNKQLNNLLLLILGNTYLILAYLTNNSVAKLIDVFVALICFIAVLYTSFRRDDD